MRMEEYGILQVASEISKVETMRNGALRLKIDTQENIPSEVRMKLMGMTEKLGWFTFSVRQIEATDLIDLPEIKRDEDEKSPAQRLRASIYMLWQQEGSTGDFETYYRSKMDKLINWIKEKLT